MEELKFTIAKNLVSLRKAKKISQAELANILNYSDKAISKWERGESFPDIITFKEIADYFEVSLDYLLTYHDENEKIVEVKENVINHNHNMIMIISTGLVWLLATLGYAVYYIATKKFSFGWISFIYAIPLSSLVLLVLNSLWGNKRWNKYYESILIWGLLLSVCLTLQLFNIQVWLLMAVGLPAQFLIIFGSRLKFIKKK